MSNKEMGDVIIAGFFGLIGGVNCVAIIFKLFGVLNLSWAWLFSPLMLLVFFLITYTLVYTVIQKVQT